MREKFDPKELEIIGEYPDYPTHFMPLLPKAPVQKKYNRPITPKENWQLLFDGKKPYWIPQAGWFNCDVLVFRPRMHPDNMATRLVFDAEDVPAYKSTVGEGWFGLNWEWVDIAGGASVHPGNPAVTDIEKWEEQVPFPNLDDLDWDDCIKKNQSYTDSDKLVQAGLLSGFWERLMSLMDVENAAMALVDEDEQEGVHRLFDRCADLYVDYIDRLYTHFNISGFLIHDDWGTQNNPFFSLETCREMIVPYLKRVTDACHERGIIFELHSCGRVEPLVPALIEAGVDVWCGQTMNNYEKMAQEYKDAPIIFGVLVEPNPEDKTDDQIIARAKEFVDTFKDGRVAIVNRGVSPLFMETVYVESRKAFENE
ncbi:uroporphyrinogen decarboxylase family protein [Eubacteriaceae bacterium ES2]|nr:uroporphyrinogen decarboxylase family protein [Eubacteriaceae bacterium ES2]